MTMFYDCDNVLFNGKTNVLVEPNGWISLVNIELKLLASKGHVFSCDEL